MDEVDVDVNEVEAVGDDEEDGNDIDARAAALAKSSVGRHFSVLSRREPPKEE